jgi:hypothetical protein
MIEPGTHVRTANGYNGVVIGMDTKTYSIPFCFIEVIDGRFAGDRIYVSEAEVIPLIQ